MELPLSLSLRKRLISDTIDTLNHEDAKKAAKLANEALLVQKASYDELLKHRWGLVPPAPTKRFGFTLFGWWIGVEKQLVKQASVKAAGDPGF